MSGWLIGIDNFLGIYADRNDNYFYIKRRDSFSTLNISSNTTIERPRMTLSDYSEDVKLANE